MQVTKCDRCGEIYQPMKQTFVGYGEAFKADGFFDPVNLPNCSRLCMTNKNKDYDLCEKCTEEILKSFKGETD